MKFNLNFYHPLKPETVELGVFPSDQIINQFEKIAWNDYLQEVHAAKIDDIYHYPSLEIVHKESKKALVISVVGDPGDYDFNISFKRPKIKKSLWGLNNQINENYLTTINAQTNQDVLKCIQAFLSHDEDYLEKKVGI